MEINISVPVNAHRNPEREREVERDYQMKSRQWEQ